MEGNLYAPEKYQSISQQHKPAWYPHVRVLAFVLALCTVFSVIPPAAVMAAPEQTLNCPVVIHQHEAACYDGEGALICGVADFVVHTHTAGCYDADSTLVCPLTEVETHEHTDACFTTGQTLTCELVADENHTHGEGCYESVQTQICTKEVIVLHTHSDACRDTNGNLICGMLEVTEHIHGDDCFTGGEPSDITPPETTTATTTGETTTETTAETTAETTTETTVETTTETTEATETPIMLLGATIVAEGDCGEGAKWALTDDGVLTIYGSGPMADYSSGTDAPWYSYRSQFRSVVVGNGVTSAGNYVFYDYDNLTSVTILGGVTSVGNYAFHDCDSITQLVLPAGLKSIGTRAFTWAKITELTIPDSVTSIGDSAFYACRYLTSITIPKGVTTISNGTFQSCSSLTSVTIPEGVTSIGNSAFSSCSKLTSITIPESVTSIGSGAFSSCSSLISITIPESVETIGSSAFSSCSKLTSVTIPEKVTTIGSYAFQNCSSLTSITIPNGVTSVDSGAFSGCSNLTSITIPENVTTIGSSAFYGCSKLTSINIPENVTTIGSSAFYGCSSLTSINIPENVTTIGGSAFYGCTGLTGITIPEKVTTIGDSAFSNCSGLTSITIPASITSIGSSAFSGCSSLAEIVVAEDNQKYCSVDGALYSKDQTILYYYPSAKAGSSEVTLPDSVTTISSYAFSGCSGLTSIAIPENVKTIGNNAFYNCSNLTSVVIPEGITTINSSTFYGCSSLTDITIPSGVTSISTCAFSGCSSLTDITIPEGVKNIYSQAFYGCSSLTNITIPEKVTSISDTTFYGCSSLTSVTLPDGLKTIGSSAFSGCSSLTDITIPDSVTYIDSYAFRGCSSLTSITIPENVQTIRYNAFYDCDGLTEIVIPDSVTSLGSEAFEDCDSLERVVIGDGISTINSETFYSCDKLSHLVIGDSVTTIASDAFQGCSKLTSITIGKSLTSLDAFSFSSYSGLTEIIVDEENPAYCSVDGALYSRDPMVLLVYPRKTDSTEVMLPEGVESIADRAFYNCDSLTSITIPDSVISIGNYAFYDCDNLESVVIGDGVTTIGTYAFSSCNKLANVTLGSSVESIGENAFSYCDNLTEIAIPDSVTEIKNSAFYDCDGLTSLSIPDSVISIGNRAFYECDNLDSVIIGDGVKTIGNSAFYSCDKLTNLTIGSSVESIGTDAFMYCDGLTSVAIPNSVTSIGSRAFYDCDGLTSITIPDNVTTLGSEAFSWCDKLESAVIGDGVTVVPSNAFGSCSKLTSVSIGKNVTQISSTAFYNCGSLAGFEVDPENEAFCSVDGVLYSKDMTTLLRYPPNKTEPRAFTVPDSVTAIADSAFEGCSGLTKITLPENVTSIGNSAFSGCTGLTSVNVPDNVNAIGNSAFYNCRNLTSIHIPKGVTTIGNSTFYYCEKLVNVVIPEGVTAIGNSAFYECGQLKSITIPEGVTSIGASAFYYCSNLTSITIPEGVTTIASSTFSDCSRLTSIIIPKSVTSIGNYAFYRCGSLADITIPESVQSIGYKAFYSCSDLISIVIPDGVTSIDSETFRFCSDLTSIVIPGSVTSIGKEAFSYCSYLTNITIENSSVTFGENALYNCPRLKHVTIGRNADTITSAILDTLGANSGGITKISANGPNYFRYTGTDYAVEKMTMTEGDYYADAHGVIYRLNSDGTAALIYAPDELSAEQYEIPASIPAEDSSRNYTVTVISDTAFQGCKDLKGITIPGSVAVIGDSTFKDCKSLKTVTLSDGITTIGDEAFRNCGALTEVTIPDSVTSIGHYAFQNCGKLAQVTIPEDIAGIGVYAFGDCYRLARVNGESSLSAVVEMLSGGGATPATFLNSALTGDDETVTVDDILVESGDGRQIGLSTPVTQGLTGEWLETKLSISTGKADNASVVRVYFQFTNEHGTLKYPVGTHTFDGIEAETFAADIPNTYYIQFQPMKAEDERGISLYSTYTASVSGGGAARIWAEALTIEEAEALGNGVTEPQTAHRLAWSATQPDTYQITMSLSSWTSGFQGDGTPEGDAALGGSNYNIKMTQIGESAEHGTDHIVRVDFVNTVILPEYFKWPEGVVDAINKGNWHVRHSGSTAYYYVTAGGKTHYLAYVNTSNAGEAKLAVDASGNIQFHWTYMNPDTSKAVSSISPYFYMQDKVILVNKDKLYEAGAGEGTSISCTVENQLTATQHFAYSEDQVLEATATRTVSAGMTCTVDVYIPYSVTMGGKNTYSLTLNNTSALPYTKLDCVTTSMQNYYHIVPADIEAMFYNSPYGKDLSITITNANLYTTSSHTVTGTNGEDHVITHQFESDGTSYEGCVSSGNDIGIVAEKVTMTIGWSDDRSNLVLTVGETNYSIGPGCEYSSLQEAFLGIGYVVTYSAQYACRWNQEGQTLYCGESRKFEIPATAKDVFARLTRDQNYNSDYNSNIYVYGYAYSVDGKSISSDSDYSYRLYRDFSLSKSVYSGEIALTEETPVTAGDVLTYRVSVDHDGTASYDAIPLVDNMEAGQVLLVSVADNPTLADQGLETMEVDGASFYLLNKAGIYEDVMVGNLLADRVEIKITNGAIDTIIYWYLTGISGNVTVTAEYLALVSPETSNSVTEDGTIQLVNEVWLNDRQTHRLYDDTLVYAMTLEEISKDIVTTPVTLPTHDPAKDELATRTVVSSGQTVTYRLMLKAAEGTEHTIRGNSLSDALPLNPNGYWGPDNVTVTYIPGADSSVEITNGDSWRIDTENSNSKRQYLRWNDDFSATVEGTLYIYVTLTFPTGEQWSAYCDSYHNTELTGIFQAYHLTAQVSHLLSVPSEALLQQGVQFTGLTGPIIDYDNGNYSIYSTTYRINSEADSLRTYTNDAQYAGIVTYYITLYNSGESRLYLSDIQTVLPEGFTFYGLYSTPSSGTYYANTYQNSSNYRHYDLISLRDADRSSISSRSVDVYAKTEVNADGRQVATFTLSGCSYDSHWGKYYLNSGEAVVIAYHCRTNGSAKTQDTATSVVSMPFYDYTGTGVQLDTATVVDRKETSGKDSNNGSRLLVTNGGAATRSVDTGDADMTTLWLASEVTVNRGGIQPGITKTAAEPYAHVRDPITWSIQASNSGKDDMRGYTLTDVMMSPYQFTGTVSYRVAYDYNTALYAYNDDLFTFGPRTPGDSVVTITYGSNKTAELTVNGGCQQIETSMRVLYSGTTNYLDKTITIGISLSRDDNGNEVLSVLFPADTAAAANIPAHGSATMTLQTRNFSGVYSNTSFYNTAYITPGEEQPFDANAVTQGNYVVYGGADSVASEDSVTVSYGYYTPAYKSVAEIGKTSNSAISTDSTSHIVLDDAASPFRYTLMVHNTGGTADSVPMDLLVFVDNLPQVGDHATFHPEIQRYSQFQVNFFEEPNFTINVNDTMLDEEVYVLQFSKKTEFGQNDLNGTSIDGWYTLEEINADASLSLKDMRSFRVVIQDDTGKVIPGDAQITVDFNAEIDLSQGDIEPSSTAWNSFGYHYSLAGSAEELSASSQNVGVRTAMIPCLVKELRDTDGNPFAAKEDTTFRFVIYEGEAMTLPSAVTQEEVFTALSNSTFTVVELTVKAGESTSQTLGLSDLYCYRYENGSLVTTDTAWLWKNATKYTIVELPLSSENIYGFGSFNETNPNNYTFGFNSSVAQLFTCSNVCNIWGIQLQKQCQLTAEPLAGAVFGLYSPAAVDRISDERFGTLTAQLENAPQKTVEVDGRTWYLMDIRTTDDEGRILWNDLSEKQYYLLELQAPAGYHPNKQPGQVIQAVDEIAMITVTNAPCYELPDSGGMGTTMLYAAGAVMTGFSLLMGWNKRRKGKTNP